MNWTVKKFEELSIDELYELIRLRIEVFVVEQDCPYQELDSKDQEAIHLFGRRKGELVAYSRLFPKSVVNENSSIGRVIVKECARGKGYGQALLAKAIEYLEVELQETKILIHAQLYLQEFYESFGFKKVSDIYLLDGINHLDMRKERYN